MIGDAHMRLHKCTKIHTLTHLLNNKTVIIVFLSVRRPERAKSVIVAAKDKALEGHAMNPFMEALRSQINKSHVC